MDGFAHPSPINSFPEAQSLTQAEVQNEGVAVSLGFAQKAPQALQAPHRTVYLLALLPLIS